MARKGIGKGNHPNSRAALKKHGFKPGQSGNPKGGPCKEHSITHKQREMLPLPCPYSKKGETWLEWLADRGMALAGENPAYYRELMDRLEGKVTQPIGGEDGGPIEVSIDYKQKIFSAISRHATGTGEDEGDPEP